jgi:hypothetical protein
MLAASVLAQREEHRKDVELLAERVVETCLTRPDGDSESEFFSAADGAGHDKTGQGHEAKVAETGVGYKDTRATLYGAWENGYGEVQA